MRRWSSGWEADPDRFGLLVASLLFMVLAQPFAERSGQNSLTFTVLFSILLLFSVWTLAGRRKTLLIAISLVIPILAFQWIGLLTGQMWAILAGSLAAFVFLTLVAAMILRNVLRSEQVTVHKILGALAAYMLMAILWGLLYIVVDKLDPGAFKSAQPLQREDFFYFSLVTLTTLGYGDIVPIAPQARSLVMLEALLGQIYLAVLVARLVGLQITHSKAR